MDEEVREPIRANRWLAWAVAGLLVAGVASVGAVDGRDEGADQRIVTAAGETARGVEVPTTVHLPVAPLEPPVAPPLPPLPSTTTIVATVPRPTSTTATPTTKPAAATTTTKAPAASTSTTKAPAPAGTTLNVVNEHPLAVVVTVNGKTFQVAPGQQSGPTAVTRAPSGNDVVEVALVQEPSCAIGDADRYFPTAGSYRLTVTAGQGLCQPGMPGPLVKVTPA